MSNDILIEEITKLTDQWYQLIGKDHHKDRDCHWYLEAVWSYGLPPKYRVSHRGYILDHIEEEFETWEDGLLGLRALLQKSIEEVNDYRLKEG